VIKIRRTKEYYYYPDDYYYPLPYYAYPPHKKYEEIKGDTQVFISEKIQKFILENVFNPMEWYIIAYGYKEIKGNVYTFVLEEFIFPLQERTGSSVEIDPVDKTRKHVKILKEYPDYEALAIIHSHNSMKAFFSSIDEDDIDDTSKFFDIGVAIVFAYPTFFSKKKKDYKAMPKFKKWTMDKLDLDMITWHGEKRVVGKKNLYYFDEDEYEIPQNFPVLEENDKKIAMVLEERERMKLIKEIGKTFYHEKLTYLSIDQLNILEQLILLAPHEANNLIYVFEQGERV